MIKQPLDESLVRKLEELVCLYLSKNREGRGEAFLSHDEKFLVGTVSNAALAKEADLTSEELKEAVSYFKSPYKARLTFVLVDKVGDFDSAEDYIQEIKSLLEYKKGEEDKLEKLKEKIGFVPISARQFIDKLEKKEELEDQIYNYYMVLINRCFYEDLVNLLMVAYLERQAAMDGKEAAELSGEEIHKRYQQSLNKKEKEVDDG